MGNGSRDYSARVKPIAEQEPKTKRAEFAGRIVEDLLKILNESVLMPESALNKSRECYEVSRDLRREHRAFDYAIRQVLPGSEIRPWVGQKQGMTLAEKINMVFMNHIDTVIIRPGPMPEDRQAHDMVGEAWALQTELTYIVAAIITVDDKARGLA